MGGTRSTRGIDEKCIQYFGRENLKGGEHSDVDERIILKWILGKQCEKL